MVTRRNITIYDQFGRKIDLSAHKRPDQAPLAVAPVRDSFREYVTDGLTPQRLARVFRAADAGDVRLQAELFDQLEEKDAHLLCERDKRKNVILDLDFEVTPASDSPRDKQIAEFVAEVFASLTDWDDTIVSLQDAVGKGCAGLEICWDVSNGQAIPERFDFIEQRRMLYSDAAGLLRRYPLLVTDEDSMGVEIPPWKMILHKYGGKSGHPTRSGIYRVAAWMILFKHYSIKDWVVFCEVYGMPLRLGRYDQGATSAEKEALRQAISSLGSDAAGVISKSTEIEFVDSVKNAKGDLYKLLADFCNAEISKSMLGQTLTTEVNGSGSYAASKTHNEVRLDLLRADGRAIASTVRTQLIRPLVGFNFGWDASLPNYNAQYVAPDDLVEKSKWMSKMLEVVSMPRSFVREQFSIPDREGDEEMVGGLSGGGMVPAKLKSAPKPLPPASMSDDPVGTILSAALENTDMDDILAPARALLGEVSSLEEYRDRLLSIYGAMDISDLASVMQQSFVLADLAGQFDGRPQNDV